MPIELSIPVRIITQDEYHAIDRVMLGQAFQIHNEYGRLLDEEFYKTELARRCSQVGLAVAREVLIRVRHGHFSQDYFIDLLLDGSTIIEGKCAQAITPAHRGQTLNYLLLAGTHHGSLVNFRPFKVKREFVSTQLTHDLRRRFTVSRHHWPDDAAHQRLLDVACAFCADVGLGLDLTLYRQAFTTLMGGPSLEPQPVAIFSGERVVHEQAMYLVTDDVGLAVTAMSSLDDTRRHLQRLLNNTRLKGIAWINLPLNELRFEFLERQNHGGVKA
jgi:GxxExxY protein